MVTQEKAMHFAKEWIQAWNSHNIDAIMEHYDETIAFNSPLVAAILNRPDSSITGKAELRSYFLKGLAAYPDLTFELYNVLSGTNSLVIYYKSVKKLVGSEVFILNEKGLATTCMCHYTEI